MPWNTVNLQAIERALHETGAPAEALKEWTIAVQELISPVLGFAKWAWDHPGAMFLAVTDNDNAKTWLNKRQADNGYVQFMLDMVSRIEHATGCRLVAAYVGTKSNKWADDSTRVVQLIGEDLAGVKEFETSLLAEHPGYTQFDVQSLFDK